MNYLLAIMFGAAGIILLVWNKPLSDKFGAFYARQFSATFGGLAHLLGWDNPDKRFNKFVYRAAVITLGAVLLVFAIAALTGTNFIGPTAQRTDYLLQQSQYQQ